jgi:hypothetical protein
VFLFLHVCLFALPLPSPSPSPSCCYRNKGKMWRLVTVRTARALLAPLSFPLIFILSMVSSFLFSSPSPCLCFVAGTKAKIHVDNNQENIEKAQALLPPFLHPQSICLRVCHNHHYSRIRKAWAFPTLFLHS